MAVSSCLFEEAGITVPERKTETMFLTPKEARGVRHEELANTKMEPSLDPDDYIEIRFASDPSSGRVFVQEDTPR